MMVARMEGRLPFESVSRRQCPGLLVRSKTLLALLLTQVSIIFD